MSDRDNTNGNDDEDEPTSFMRSWLLMGAAAVLIILVLAVLIIQAAASGAPAITVVDGDTIYVGEEKVRIVGLDTPETYQARCEAERRAGQRATNYLRSLVAGGSVRLERQAKPDRYGRTLARVYIGGRDVAAVMISEGYAVAYDCPRGRCPRRIDWCERLGGRNG